MGGNLTDLIGESNTQSTGDLGSQSIIDALTYQGLFAARDLNVRAIPVNAEEIMFVITVNTSTGDPFKLPIIFNLTYGLKEV
jgi:hypothetical protein